GTALRRPITSMPGVSQTSPDELLRDCAIAAKAGIGGVILFGIPDRKDAIGTEAWSDEGGVQTAVRLLKKELPEMVVITDVCMCEYTDHGHCGILENGEVRNDETLELLSRASLSHAAAGADVIAPSDMMDGRVAAIRSALDENGFSDIPILSYAAKYASAYYGPFRDAAESAPKAGDRKGYQMDAANSDEALREVFADIEEGADAIMVKPAGPYLDVISRVKEATGYPLSAYQVSGEYAMICAAAERGWIDKDRVVMESLLAIRRAGADFILTYFAVDAARALSAGF
ncbi:MAG TPA: porphobilinogen synthase, partial [Gemmatimonadaceae bacterium]|nr:porphobilinogen synthase [Gemmatimonadaceae bacterium]